MPGWVRLEVTTGAQLVPPPCPSRAIPGHLDRIVYTQLWDIPREETPQPLWPQGWAQNPSQSCWESLPDVPRVRPCPRDTLLVTTPERAPIVTSLGMCSYCLMSRALYLFWNCHLFYQAKFQICHNVNEPTEAYKQEFSLQDTRTNLAGFPSFLLTTSKAGYFCWRILRRSCFKQALTEFQTKQMDYGLRHGLFIWESWATG